MKLGRHGNNSCLFSSAFKLSGTIQMLISYSQYPFTLLSWKFTQQFRYEKRSCLNIRTKQKCQPTDHRLNFGTTSSTSWGYFWPILLCVTYSYDSYTIWVFTYSHNSYTIWEYFIRVSTQQLIPISRMSDHTSTRPRSQLHPLVVVGAGVVEKLGLSVGRGQRRSLPSIFSFRGFSERASIHISSYISYVPIRCANLTSILRVWWSCLGLCYLYENISIKSN